MNDFLSRDVKKFQKRRARRHVWHSVLTVLASIVVFATTYALILPAITMTAVHVHDESCYTQATTTEKEILACLVSAESGLVVVHRHDSRCYDEDGTLVCTLPELAAHVHTEACYDYPEAHVHTDACYSEERGELICGLEEGEEHTHTDDCYAWETVLSCGQTEEEPAEPVLVCGKKEIVLHRHDEDCYAADGTLTCALPEVIEHQHTGKCFKTVQVPVDTQALTCTNTDPDHVHTALCYGTWVLTCDQGTDDTTPEEPADEDPADDPGSEDPAEDEDPDDADSEDPGAEDSENPEDPKNPEDPENPEDEQPEDGADTYASEQMTLRYYVYLDGSLDPVLEESRTLERENGRYYITAQQLETVYGDFGFEADSYQGERFFPHTDLHNTSLIWADVSAYQAENADGTQEWRIPLSSTTTSYIYYLPHNTQDYGSYFEGSASNTNAALISDNTFYTVNISAPPDAASESKIDHVLNGATFSVELSVFDDYTWSYTNLADGSEITPSDVQELEGGKLFIKFRNVSHPIKVTARKTSAGEQIYTIRYHADTLADCLERIGSVVTANAQSVITDGKVGGMATLTEQVTVTADTIYPLRSPDSLRVVSQADPTRQAKHFFYTFRGWRVKATNTVLDPAQPLTAVQLAGYENGGVIELEAVWSVKDANGRVTSVNFFIHLFCEIKDFHSNGFTNNPVGDYTKSLFTTTLLGTDALSSSGNLLVLAPPTTDATAYETDDILRTMTDTPYDGLTMEAFPSDREMFALLRENNYTIKIGNSTIPQSKLTSDYFQVRWTNLKYDISDGWHVDGVLVAKEAKLRVTKTFLGSNTAIEKIKARTGTDEYSILVENITANDADDERLTLMPADQETREDCLGYDSYDEATNTYTWIARGRIDSTYELSEQNYLLTDTHTGAYYRIYDTTNPGSWQVYDDRSFVQTAMISYASDTPQRRYRTVSFQNTYVETGMLTLRKTDAFTENGIANVSFRLTPDDEEAGTLLRKPGTSMYTNAHFDDEEYTEDAGDTIITNANGDVYLRLMPGSYTLREAFPEGYSGAEEIRFTVNSDGTLTELTYDGQALEASTGGVSSGVGTKLLLVENRSHMLTTVTAVKDWGEVPEDWQEPVTVTLMYDGAPLGGVNSEYTQVLSPENNWTYVWEDLPLFLDGEVADYTLKEIMIGDTPYDSALPDGYSGYAVRHDPARYREGDMGDYDEKASWVDEAGNQHYANHVLLTVRNRPDGDVGKITVTKLFASIDGKKLEKIDGTYTFALYKSPDAAGTPVATASVIYGNGTITPEDGIVRFEGLTLGKTYYVFELDDSGRPVPNGETRIISGMPCSAFGGGTAVALSSEHPGGEAEITNRINYAELPETGGHGARTIYAAGGMLLACALTLLLLQKRRKAHG